MDFLDSTTYDMVRQLNVVIAGATDDEVRPFIQVHALPRVKFRMLTATDTLGRNVFYGRISDLSQPEVQRAAELLLEQVLAVDVVTEGVRQIVAKLACSMMTTQIAAQLEAQRDYAYKLEKQAMKDLDDLIRSPVLGGVVTAIKATVVERQQAQSFGVALDVDPGLINRTHLTAVPYESAQALGEIRLYVDGVPLVVPVVPGDTPSQLMRKLSLLTVQQAGLRQIELISMDQTSPARTFGKVVTVDEVTYPVKVTTSVTEARLQSRTTSGVVASVANLALVSRVQGQLRPGLEGFTLGYANDYSSFSPTLNPVILGDIKNCDFVLPSDTGVCFSPSDLLAFNVPNGTLNATKADNTANTFKYRLSQIVTGTSTFPARNSGEVTIAITDGMTALDLVEAIAKDLGRRRANQNVLGAVLPVIEVRVGLASVFAPALDLVGYVSDQDLEVRYMFQITAMPEGLQTTLATRAYEAPAFSEEADAVVIYAIALGRTEIVEFDSQGGGSAKAVEATPSTQMSEALERVRNMINRGM